MIPSDYAQLSYVFGGVGLPTEAVVTCGLNVELWTGTPDQAAAMAKDKLVAAAIVSSLSNTIIHLRTEVKFGPEPIGPTGVSLVSTGGGQAGSFDSPASAMLVKKSTGMGGRGNRGRWYWPGVPETQINAGGVLTTGFVADMQTKFATWLASMATAGLVPVILHSDPDTVGDPPPIILAMNVDNRLATQRRRLRR